VEALPKPKGFTFIEEIRHHIFLYTAMILFSILLRTRNRLLESEQAKHAAEINSLKEQINPHFLFNTLNSIYALAIPDQSATTANAILKLSGMMRYIVTETSSTFVALQKELSYVKDYIDLQRLRLDKRIKLSFEITGSVGDQVIAPLTLIPFIENAFKHGVNPDEYSRINILVEVQETELTLTVENNKVTTTLSSHEHSGKGIANTRSRLQLLYPSRHLLILKEDENHFHVQLTIQLQ
jgi:sensor histidine kinase YesM